MCVMTVYTAYDRRVYEGRGSGKKFEEAAASFHQAVGKYLATKISVSGKGEQMRMCPAISAVAMKSVIDKEMAAHIAREKEILTGEGAENHENDPLRQHLAGLVAMQKGEAVKDGAKEKAHEVHRKQVTELHKKVC
jgi:hypothetical protein